VGGQDATLGQYPWLVNLGYQRNGAGETLFKCGGTLIGPRHVVTAAHCVTDLPSGFALAVVRVGEHDLASEQDCQSGVCSPDPQDMKVRKIVFHPSYGKPNAFQNDIAVISLEEDSSGRSLPKVCCPSAALVAQEQAGAPSHPYSSHQALRLLAPESTCGPTPPNIRIVGGQDATLGQYPWLVNLGYQRNGAGETLFKCGGTLIGPRHVVTAAHCVTDLPSGFALAVVRVGEHDLASEQDCQSGVCSPDPQDMKVRKIVFHPSYGKPNAFQNDIAVISLEEEVQQNDFVIPICLPFNDEGDDYLTPEEGEEVDVAGWGATTETGRRPATVLQFLGVEVTNGTECKEVYAERGGVITPSQICAGGQKGRVCTF